MRGVDQGPWTAGRISGGPPESDDREPAAAPQAADPCGEPLGDPPRGRLWPGGPALGGIAPNLKSPSGAPPQTTRARFARASSPAMPSPPAVATRSRHPSAAAQT